MVSNGAFWMVSNGAFLMVSTIETLEIHWNKLFMSSSPAEFFFGGKNTSLKSLLSLNRVIYIIGTNFIGFYTITLCYSKNRVEISL
jgi:hypothetical protein